MKTIAQRAIPALLSMLASSLAFASGFDAQANNASGLGVAFAGSAAVADNASTLAVNPASISRLDGLRFSTGLVFKDATQRIRGSGDAGEDGTLANVAMSLRVSPALTAGLSVSSPYHLNHRYSDAWAGAGLALRTELQTRSVSPALAYRLNDQVALGFALNYQQMDLRLTQVGADFKADDGSLGWTAGALYSPSPAMRVGVAYRSGVKHDLSGRFNLNAAKARIETPASLTLSVWQQVSEQWEAMGDLSYTRWNSVEPFAVRDKNNGNVLSTQGFNLDNAWRLAWGAAYRFSDQGKFKFGFAYERSATDSRQRTLQLPDNDQLWLSTGLQWRFNPQHWVDLGYAYRHQRDARVSQGAVQGKLRKHEHLLGLQYSAGF